MSDNYLKEPTSSKICSTKNSDRSSINKKTKSSINEKIAAQDLRNTNCLNRTRAYGFIPSSTYHKNTRNGFNEIVKSTARREKLSKGVTNLRKSSTSLDRVTTQGVSSDSRQVNVRKCYSRVQTTTSSKDLSPNNGKVKFDPTHSNIRVSNQPRKIVDIAKKSLSKSTLMSAQNESPKKSVSRTTGSLTGATTSKLQSSNSHSSDKKPPSIDRIVRVSDNQQTSQTGATKTKLQSSNSRSSDRKPPSIDRIGRVSDNQQTSQTEATTSKSRSSNSRSTDRKPPSIDRIVRDSDNQQTSQTGATTSKSQSPNSCSDDRKPLSIDRIVRVSDNQQTSQQNVITFNTTNTIAVSISTVISSDGGLSYDELLEGDIHESLLRKDLSSVQDEDDQEKAIAKSPNERFLKFDVEIGRGSFKTVYRGLDTESGVSVAWCELQDNKLTKMERQRFKEEAEMLKRLEHSNIVRFYDCWEDSSKRGKFIVLVTELMTSGTLKSYLKKFNKKINMKVIKSWCKQIVKGLNFLHSRTPPVIHRDLKCDNIFITGTSGCVKIGDLGLATLKNRSYAKSVIGTPEFMAPEMYDEHYDEKVDVYAFGMCILEMATAEYPYNECQNPAQIFRKVSSGVKPQNYLKVDNPELRDLIDLCIQGREERPTIRELMDHEFFNDDLGLKLDIVNKESSVITDSTKLVFRLQVTDPNKRTKIYKENEAVQFNYDIEVDKPVEIANDMTNSGHIFESDVKYIVMMLKSRLVSFKRDREEAKARKETLHHNVIDFQPVTATIIDVNLSHMISSQSLEHATIIPVHDHQNTIPGIQEHQQYPNTAIQIGNFSEMDKNRKTSFHDYGTQPIQHTQITGEAITSDVMKGDDTKQYYQPPPTTGDLKQTEYQQMDTSSQYTKSVIQEDSYSVSVVAGSSTLQPQQPYIISHNNVEGRTVTSKELSSQYDVQTSQTNTDQSQVRQDIYDVNQKNNEIYGSFKKIEPTAESANCVPHSQDSTIIRPPASLSFDKPSCEAQYQSQQHQQQFTPTEPTYNWTEVKNETSTSTPTSSYQRNEHNYIVQNEEARMSPQPSLPSSRITNPYPISNSEVTINEESNYNNNTNSRHSMDSNNNRSVSRPQQPVMAQQPAQISPQNDFPPGFVQSQNSDFMKLLQAILTSLHEQQLQQSQRQLEQCLLNILKQKKLDVTQEQINMISTMMHNISNNTGFDLTQLNEERNQSHYQFLSRFSQNIEAGESLGHSSTNQIQLMKQFDAGDGARKIQQSYSVDSGQMAASNTSRIVHNQQQEQKFQNVVLVQEQKIPVKHNAPSMERDSSPIASTEFKSNNTREYIDHSNQGPSLTTRTLLDDQVAAAVSPNSSYGGNGVSIGDTKAAVAKSTPPQSVYNTHQSQQMDHMKPYCSSPVMSVSSAVGHELTDTIAADLAVTGQSVGEKLATSEFVSTNSTPTSCLTDTNVTSYIPQSTENKVLKSSCSTSSHHQQQKSQSPNMNQSDAMTGSFENNPDSTSTKNVSTPTISNSGNEPAGDTLYHPQGREPLSSDSSIHEQVRQLSHTQSEQDDGDMNMNRLVSIKSCGSGANVSEDASCSQSRRSSGLGYDCCPALHNSCNCCSGSNVVFPRPLFDTPCNYATTSAFYSHSHSPSPSPPSTYNSDSHLQPSSSPNIVPNINSCISPPPRFQFCCASAATAATNCSNQLHHDSHFPHSGTSHHSLLNPSCEPCQMCPQLQLEQHCHHHQHYCNHHHQFGGGGFGHQIQTSLQKQQQQANDQMACCSNCSSFSHHRHCGGSNNNHNGCNGGHNHGHGDNKHGHYCSCGNSRHLSSSSLMDHNNSSVHQIEQNHHMPFTYGYGTLSPATSTTAKRKMSLVSNFSTDSDYVSDANYLTIDSSRLRSINEGVRFVDDYRNRRYSMGAIHMPTASQVFQVNVEPPTPPPPPLSSNTTTDVSAGYGGGAVFTDGIAFGTPGMASTVRRRGRQNSEPPMSYTAPPISRKVSTVSSLGIPYPFDTTLLPPVSPRATSPLPPASPTIPTIITTAYDVGNAAADNASEMLKSNEAMTNMSYLCQPEKNQNATTELNKSIISASCSSSNIDIHVVSYPRGGQIECELNIPNEVNQFKFGFNYREMSAEELIKQLVTISNIKTSLSTHYTQVVALLQDIISKLNQSITSSDSVATNSITQTYTTQNATPKPIPDDSGESTPLLSTVAAATTTTTGDCGSSACESNVPPSPQPQHVSDFVKVNPAPPARSEESIPVDGQSQRQQETENADSAVGGSKFAQDDDQMTKSAAVAPLEEPQHVEESVPSGRRTVEVEEEPTPLVAISKTNSPVDDLKENKVRKISRFLVSPVISELKKESNVSTIICSTEPVKHDIQITGNASPDTEACKHVVSSGSSIDPHTSNSSMTTSIVSSVSSGRVSTCTPPYPLMSPDMTISREELCSKYTALQQDSADSHISGPPSVETLQRKLTELSHQSNSDLASRSSNYSSQTGTPHPQDVINESSLKNENCSQSPGQVEYINSPNDVPAQTIPADCTSPNPMVQSYHADEKEPLQSDTTDSSSNTNPSETDGNNYENLGLGVLVQELDKIRTDYMSGKGAIPPNILTIGLKKEMQTNTSSDNPEQKPSTLPAPISPSVLNKDELKRGRFSVTTNPPLHLLNIEVGSFHDKGNASSQQQPQEKQEKYILQAANKINAIDCTAATALVPNVNASANVLSLGHSSGSAIINTIPAERCIRQAMPSSRRLDKSRSCTIIYAGGSCYNANVECCECKDASVSNEALYYGYANKNENHLSLNGGDAICNGFGNVVRSWKSENSLDWSRRKPVLPSQGQCNKLSSAMTEPQPRDILRQKMMTNVSRGPTRATSPLVTSNCSLCCTQSIQHSVCERCAGDSLPSLYSVPNDDVQVNNDTIPSMMDFDTRKKIIEEHVAALKKKHNEELLEIVARQHLLEEEFRKKLESVLLDPPTSMNNNGSSTSKNAVASARGSVDGFCTAPQSPDGTSSSTTSELVAPPSTMSPLPHVAIPPIISTTPDAGECVKSEDGIVIVVREDDSQAPPNMNNYTLINSNISDTTSEVSDQPSSPHQSSSSSSSSSH